MTPASTQKTLRVKYEEPIRKTLMGLGVRADELNPAMTVIFANYGEHMIKKFCSGGVETRKLQQTVMKQVWSQKGKRRRSTSTRGSISRRNSTRSRSRSPQP